MVLTCRLRFDFSMMSSSVHVTAPPPHATPIIAKFLKNSQPRAPEPTRKVFSLPSFSWKALKSKLVC